MPVILRQEIAALPPYRQGKGAGPDAFKLSSNENPAPVHLAVLEAIAASSLNRYPDGAQTALRERLAELHGVTVDEVHAGAGSVSLLHQLVQAAAGPGDEVLYAWRSFEAYPGVVTVAGATSVTVPNRPDGGHDLAAMSAAVTERTRAVILCTPNNPTGPIVTVREFEEFADALPATVLLILDEAYREFVEDPDAVNGIPLLERYPNLVVLRTFSKAYGLAGLRIGYAVGPAYVLDAARSTQISLSVTEPAQRAALAALEHADEILATTEPIRERRARILDGLRAQGWGAGAPNAGDGPTAPAIPDAQGNFVWLPTGDRTAAAAEVLERHGIVARVFPEGIRVTVGEEESVEPLLAGTAEVVELLARAS